MKELGKDLKIIYMEHRALFAMMLLLLIGSVAFLVFALVTLSPASAVVKVGYGDIGRYQGDGLSDMRTAGGYRDGSWTSMFAFPVAAIVMGVLHNIIATKLLKRRGAAVAVAFLGISMIVLAGFFVTLARLLGEG